MAAWYIGLDSIYFIYRFSDAGWHNVKDHDPAYTPSSDPSESSEAESYVSVTSEEPDTTETLQAGRDRIERQLRQPIFVKRYPGRAGEVLEEIAEAQSYGYGGYASSDKNLYAPFAHRLDWEVARWCQLRGPGSTAVTELLSIDGVCAIKLINKYSHL